MERVGEAPRAPLRGKVAHAVTPNGTHFCVGLSRDFPFASVEQHIQTFLRVERTSPRMVRVLARTEKGLLGGE